MSFIWMGRGVLERLPANAVPGASFFVCSKARLVSFWLPVQLVQAGGIGFSTCIMVKLLLHLLVCALTFEREQFLLLALQFRLG